MAKLSGRWAAIYFAGYDLTGVSRQFDATVEYAELDATAFQHGAKNSMPGLGMGSVSLEVFLDAASGLTYDSLSAASLGVYSNAHLLILLGANTTPTIGDECLLMTVKQFTFNTPLSASTAVIASATFSTQEKTGWGHVLANTTITNTTNFTSIVGENGLAAKSKAGGQGILQVLTLAASDTYVVKIQDAPDDSTWADLITFVSLDGSAIGSEMLEVSGDVDKDVRAQATRTGAAAQDFKLAVGWLRY